MNETCSCEFDMEVKCAHFDVNKAPNYLLITSKTFRCDEEGGARKYRYVLHVCIFVSKTKSLGTSWDRLGRASACVVKCAHKKDGIKRVGKAKL